MSPIPKPFKGEKSKKFISRFMKSKVMKKEYPQKQRLAIAFSELRSKGRKV